MRLPPMLSALLAAACLAGAGVLAFGDVADPAPVVEPTTAPSTPTPAPTAEASSVPTSTPTELPPPPADRAAVVADLLALLADPEFDSEGAVAVSILDEHGRVVLERAPDATLLPASTMKSLTAAAALVKHGPDGRIRTRVLVDGPVSGRGTLLGSVYVVAGGDPSLASEEYRRFVFPARPSTDTAQLVALLRSAGIERVDGDLVADPGAFADQRRPEGWRDAYLQEFDARFITGLTVDAGLEVLIDHPRDTWPTLTGDDLEEGGFAIHLAQDPLLRAATVFEQELARGRMSVLGSATVGTAPSDAIEVGTLESPPLSDLLRFMVKESDNHLADTLLRELGATVGRSTWASSAEAVRALLGDVGVDLSSAVIADGSGLSRDNRLSAGSLARLDQVMSASAHGHVWADLQAVAGRDGTLVKRLAGTIVEGRFRGKTGTLNDVRAVVGAVEGPGGRRYHVAIVGNGGEVWRVNTLTDQILLRLTRSLWCGVDDAPSDVVVACAA